MSSGSEHFKCAACNNKQQIVKEFLRMGIYFPHKDADWEQPDNSEFYNYQGHDPYFYSIAVLSFEYAKNLFSCRYVRPEAEM